MSKNHVHKYQQIKWGQKGTVIFRCMLPDCSHYLHREMVKGKSTICWNCGAKTIMDDENLRRVKPRCFGQCGEKPSSSSDTSTHINHEPIKQLEGFREMAARLHTLIKQ